MPQPSVTPFIPVSPIIEDSGEHIAQPAPVIDPTQPAVNEPASQPDGQPQTPPAPEVMPFRWRNEQREIPIGVVDTMAQAVGAPSREALITWTQQGRDWAYNSAKVKEDQARVAAERAELQNERQRLEQYAAELESGIHQPAPGAPGYGVPTHPQYPNGGYPAGYANPGYPAPGGFAPVAPAWGYAQDPAQREQQLAQALLSIPDRVTQAVAPFVHELRQERQNQTRAQLATRAQEEQAQLNGLADSYVQKLQNGGWDTTGLTADMLIQDCNQLGLSSNPNVPWTEALETAAARRLWRTGFRQGQGAVISELETNREGTFRVPPARTPAAPMPPAMESRLQAAHKLGENITMREAIQQ